MAPQGGRDLAAAAASLTAWLGGQLPDAREVKVFDLEQPSSGGYSNEPLFFTASWTGADGAAVTRELVARIQSPGPSLFPNGDMRREHRLLTALNGSRVPLAEMLWLEDDPAVLGAPFVTMQRVRGRIAGDNPPYTAEGWVLDLGAEGQARLYDNALRATATVARVDPARVAHAGLDRPRPGETASEERVRFVGEYVEWATQGRSFPLLDAGLEWLRERCPAVDEPLFLSWGDARLGNMIVGEDLEVVAALDWEQAVIGSAELDLSWWLFSRRTHGEGLGLELPPGFPSRDATIARYEELTGLSMPHIDFYEVLSGVIGATAVMRIGDTMIDAGLLPPDSPMPAVNPASIALAGLIDAPVPTGVVTSWATT
jgi:aminoglycoside phosphotransferase (APT) family kinase protein